MNFAPQRDDQAAARTDRRIVPVLVRQARKHETMRHRERRRRERSELADERENAMANGPAHSGMWTGCAGSLGQCYGAARREATMR
jgi:hypothetical protein